MVKLNYVFLYVKEKDWGKTKDFYGKIFSRKADYESADWCEWMFDGKFRFALHRAPDDETITQNTFIGFITSDIEEFFKRAEREGWGIVNKPRKEPFGVVGEIKDTLGNVVSIFQPPQKHRISNTE